MSVFTTRLSGYQVVVFLLRGRESQKESRNDTAAVRGPSRVLPRLVGRRLRIVRYDERSVGVQNPQHVGRCHVFRNDRVVMHNPVG
jgi:hypothetical protein